MTRHHAGAYKLASERTLKRRQPAEPLDGVPHVGERERALAVFSPNQNVVHPAFGVDRKEPEQDTDGIWYEETLINSIGGIGRKTETANKAERIANCHQLHQIDVTEIKGW